MNLKFLILPVLLCSIFPETGRAGSSIQPDHDRDYSNRFDVRVGARIALDAVNFAEDQTDLDDATEFRRADARLGVRHGKYRFRADYGQGTSAGWKNVTLELRASEYESWIVGEQSVPFSMENIAGSSPQPFMEKSALQALGPGTRSGLTYWRWNDSWSIAGGVTSTALGGDDVRSAEGTSVSLRGTRLWQIGEYEHHLGASVELLELSQGASLRLRARPFSRLAERRLVDTGDVASTDLLRSWGAEWSMAHTRFHVQAEHTRSRFETLTGIGEYSGTYLLGSILVGNLNYRYRENRGHHYPSPLATGQHGLELSFRLGEIDLDEGRLSGGEQRERSLGVGGWIGHDWEWKLNWSRIETTNGVRHRDETVDVLGARLMLRL